MSSDPQARATPTSSGRDHAVNRVLWVVLALNLAVAALKIVSGSIAGALSMVADGLHSTLDASSNVVGLVGMRVARKAPDTGHPYGHRKFEALTALAISGFLFITCYELITQTAGRFRGRHQVEPGVLSFAVMLVTMAVNFAVSRHERREGTRLRSLILLADSRHTRSDIYASLGVLISLAAALAGVMWVDLVAALLIAAIIARTGYGIVTESFTVLADAQMVDPEAITQIAGTVDGVTHVHGVRSRGLPDDIHVDLHVHVPASMATGEAHQLAHEAARRIREEVRGVTDVVIHVEPEGEHED